MMGVEVAEILVGLRRFRFQSHVIFYSLEPHGVLIRAVLHAAQNARPELFE
jgi:toxin ParE1/3/4